MSRKTFALAVVPWLLAAGLAGCSSGGPAVDVGAQVKFGVDMAKRGLWSEALFRFEQARANGHGSTTVLNNLAVAYEAVGRFDDALVTYRQAVESDPNNRALRQNYSRFLEFYQAFRPKKPAAPAAEPEAGEAPPAANATPSGGMA
ncbi:MAG: tetratricopeptide repeat protein [Acidobacteria bacterium]|nr:tetratricopeptide repeat protein [Acidobacteriota bacterium]MCB9378728.1 tetratricopeptide repeat protein [Holophagales bacterium]